MPDFDSPFHRLRVTDNDGVRLLKFERNHQSSMALDDPFETDIEYVDYLHLPLAVKPDARSGAGDRARRRARSSSACGATTPTSRSTPSRSTSRSSRSRASTSRCPTTSASASSSTTVARSSATVPRPTTSSSSTRSTTTTSRGRSSPRSSCERAETTSRPTASIAYNVIGAVDRHAQQAVPQPPPDRRQRLAQRLGLPDRLGGRRDRLDAQHDHARERRRAVHGRAARAYRRRASTGGSPSPASSASARTCTAARSAAETCR